MASCPSMHHGVMKRQVTSLGRLWRLTLAVPKCPTLLSPPVPPLWFFLSFKCHLELSLKCIKMAVMYELQHDGRKKRRKMMTMMMLLLLLMIIMTIVVMMVMVIIMVLLLMMRETWWKLHGTVSWFPPFSSPLLSPV